MLIIVLLLVDIPFYICYGETGTKDVNITLVSYDILERSPDDTSVWLRYKVEYNSDRFLIDEIELDYHGPHEEDGICSDILSQSDPPIYEYIFGDILIEKPVDDDYVKEMMTKGHLEGHIVLRDRENDELCVCDCMVNSANAIMATNCNPDAYWIEVNHYEYKTIEQPDLFFRLYPGMKEYVELHPETNCYKIFFEGKEYIGPTGKAILSPCFFSSSSGLFLKRSGGIYETAAEASEAFDLLLEGQKEIHFSGIICAENSELLQDIIMNSEMYIAFSTEFAGTFDMSDAGDRFDGPKAVTLPITVSDYLTEN